LDWPPLPAAGAFEASRDERRDLIGYVVAPLAIRVLGATGSVVPGLVKFVGYVASSQSGAGVTVTSNLKVARGTNGSISATITGVAGKRRAVEGASGPSSLLATISLSACSGNLRTNLWAAID
jgi:hypothetical protein